MDKRLKSVILGLSLLVFSYKVADTILEDFYETTCTEQGPIIDVTKIHPGPSNGTDSLYSIINSMNHKAYDFSNIKKIDSLEYFITSK